MGAPEALFVALVALLVFGPSRLAGVAREWGTVLGKARRTLDKAKLELQIADHSDEWFEDQDHKGSFDGRHDI